jgi:protein-S-isoprenylcysteine O-methyltransferase Ste14
MKNALLIFLTMAAWSVLHSWLAALQTKEAVRQIFGETADRFYRLGFVLAAGLTLAPILLMVVFLPSQVLWRITPPWLYLTGTLQVVAVVGLIAGVLHTDVMAFLGLRQVFSNGSDSSEKLVIKGLYQWVRHPLYFFGLIFIWLIPVVTDLILAFNIAASLYLILGTLPEEQKLVRTFGQAYVQYQKDVPRLIPCTKRREK